MVDKKIKKTTTVHEHPMHVPVSRKNPTGITTRNQHKRRVYASTNAEELEKIFANHPKKSYHFAKFGDFHGNSRSMQWLVLKGEDGTCITAYDGDGKPCPWDPIFPTGTVPF